MGSYQSMHISPNSPHQNRQYDRWDSPPPDPRPPRDWVTTAAEGALATGLPALAGSSMGNFGVVVGTGAGAVTGRRCLAPEGTVKGAALGLLASSLGAGLGPAGVVIAAAIGVVVNLAVNEVY